MAVTTATRRRLPPSAPPRFTPVALKIQRHDGWTPARQRAFIAALAETGRIAVAARIVGMSRDSVYKLLDGRGVESFRAAMDAARRRGLRRSGRR